jgi:osmotically-inducible protein OsmY
MLKKILIILTILSLNSCIETIALSTASIIYVSKKPESFNKSTQKTKNGLVKRAFSAIILSGKISKTLHKNNQDNRFSYINFNVDQNRVLLLGRAKKQQDIDLIHKLLAKIPEIKEVINEIIISTEKQKIIADNFLTSKVKAKLLLTRDLSFKDINLEAYDQTVYLFGSVKKASYIRKASIVTSKVKGVKKVVSYLRVRK